MGRSIFGVQGRASLKNEDVIGFLFWTRFARPFSTPPLQHLLEEGIPSVWQYTINGYGREVEPNVPMLGRALDDFVALSARLPSPRCIQWRYDPILLSERYDYSFHLRCFRQIATALYGATHVVNTSLVEPYLKAVRRLRDPSVRYRRLDPERHRTVAARYPNLGQDAGDAKPLLTDLAGIAAESDMELRLCSNPEYDMSSSQCCALEGFAPYGPGVIREVAALPRGPSRTGCRCLKTLDIGMDNTCIAGCRYCYVVQSHKSAVNILVADSGSPSVARQILPDRISNAVRVKTLNPSIESGRKPSLLCEVPENDCILDDEIATFGHGERDDANSWIGHPGNVT